MATIQNLYTGNGSTTNYSFSFEYLTASHVKVSLDSVDTTAFTFANATTISFNTAPTAGQAIRIYRRTPFESPSSTFFPGSSIKAEDLNSNFDQSLYVIQEATFDTSQSATDSAAALSTANDAETKADTAISTADTASATATAAQTTANTASSDATQAATDAASAQTNATAAATSAANAAAAANEAAAFIVLANVAAIPATPSTNDRYKITDSTGIASFTPLTGLPSGPTYGSGLFVKIRYDGSSWVFVEYAANDPDDRYVNVGIPNPVLYANQAAFPSASDYHGGVAHSHADGAMYYAHAGNWIELAKDSDVPTNNNQLTNGAGYITGIADDAVTTAKIEDAAVTRDKLASTAKGKILQVVQAGLTGRSSVTGFNWTSFLSANITPVSDTSNVLVLFSVHVGSGNSYDSKLRLRRGTQVLGVGDGTGGRPPSTVVLNLYEPTSGIYKMASQSMQFLDTGISTTSQTTYDIQLASYTGVTAYINRNSNFALQPTNGYVGTPISTLTLMEVAA